MWIMPEWMKKYEPLIANTGGKSVEDTMNDKPMIGNVGRVALNFSVAAQVELLTRLHEKDLLK